MCRTYFCDFADDADARAFFGFLSLIAMELKGKRISDSKYCVQCELSLEQIRSASPVKIKIMESRPLDLENQVH